MSNVIKAYSVRYDDEAKMTIDAQQKFDKEFEMKHQPLLHTIEKQPEGFVEGLKAVVVEPLPDNEELKEKSLRIIEDAKKEAGRILSQAKRDAEQIKSDAFAQAQKNGYEEGMLQVRKEVQKLKADYDEKAGKLQKEYDSQLQYLEPQMVNIIAALVEKITGIIVEDKEDVILYLVSNAIKNMDKCDEYTIRVSKEDFEFVSMRKNLLLAAIGREVPLFISEDTSLKKNHCLIETEQKVINCSLDVQLKNLITDLKLIGGI